MRVKLSYTVDEDDILKESAKILGLSQEDMAHGVAMFRAIQEELMLSGDTAPNTEKVLEMIEDFRKALLSVDTRLLEVEDIVLTYDKYRIEKREAATEDVAGREEYYGAD
jgi:hypothetical protein